MISAHYGVFGHIAVSQLSAARSNPLECKADVAIFALGWETRSTAVEKYITLNVRKFLLLDFEFEGLQGEAIRKNKSKLESFAVASGAEVVTLRLGPSTDYQKNINLISAVLKQMSSSVGSFEGTFHNVFIECSSMPRVYIQWFIAFAFKTHSINSLEFGYSEGVYPGGEKQNFVTGVAKYVTVPFLHGSGGMGEEKFLIVGIGGDTDLFYGLIDQFSPERVALLVPRNASFPDIEGLLDQQVAKVTQAYRLDVGEVTNIDAFSLEGHLEAFEKYGQMTGRQTSISLFVCGPKVQAIASAVFACVDSRAHVKARIPTNYPHRDVQPSDRYHVYRLIDLTSPGCSLPGTF